MIDPGTPPQPAPDADTDGFWRATRQGRLALCRCVRCGAWLHPPLERCRHCEGTTAFEDVRGTGEIHSFIVVRHPVAPGYLENLPYVVALVELHGAGGVRLPARVLGLDPEDVRIGMPVQAEIVPLPGGEHHVPVFRPA